MLCTKSLPRVFTIRVNPWGRRAASSTRPRSITAWPEVNSDRRGDWCCDAAAKIWQLGSCACSWPLPRNGGQPEALSLYRNDEQASYAAEPSQSDANLAQAAALAREWELNQLADRLEELAVG